MPEQPLVSIGLPTYNRASSLRRSLESALSQTYQNVELIISDNASTDDTQAICLEACQHDRRIKYLRQPENRGATANYYEVLKQARGEFFMWLSDDDWLDSGYVSQCVSVLAECPDYSLVCGAAKCFQAGVFAYEREKINLPEESRKERVLSYYRQVIANGVFYGVMRREQLTQIPAQNLLAGDWLMMAAVAFMGKIRTLEGVFISRALGGSSTNLEELARSLGYSKLQARHHFLTMAAIIFRDIAWRSPVYESLGKFARLQLAARAFKVIFTRLCSPQWGIRTRFRRIARSLQGKTVDTRPS